MSWSPQQEAALKAAHKWLKAKTSPQIFRLFGYAGTGKTTLATELASGATGDVVFATYTGKAAMVLRSKGIPTASTIHSLIYSVKQDAVTGQPTFVLNPDSEASTAGLIVIDECSMVDDQVALDLLSYGVKVLVLGDPFQLPPVKGTGFFTNADPDFMLTEVHRQAADNPIIRMSMDIREGRGLQFGDYGESRVILRRDLEQDEVTGADQVLVGKNRTRRAFNRRLRQLAGIDSPLPVPGDRLVCLRNNSEKSLLNGGLWDVIKSAAANDNFPVPHIEARVKSIDPGGAANPVDVSVPLAFFEGTEGDLHWKDRKPFDEFDYGYALTVHKSQGSQWDNVCLFDESGTFRDTADNWLYTGVTRAAERITVVR